MQKCCRVDQSGFVVQVGAPPDVVVPGAVGVLQGDADVAVLSNPAPGHRNGHQFVAAAQSV